LSQDDLLARIREINRRDNAVIVIQSKRTLSRIESGEPAYLGTIRSIATALGVPMSAIVDESTMSTSSITEQEYTPITRRVRLEMSADDFIALLAEIINRHRGIKGAAALAFELLNHTDIAEDRFGWLIWSCFARFETQKGIHLRERVLTFNEMYGQYSPPTLMRSFVDELQLPRVEGLVLWSASAASITDPFGPRPETCVYSGTPSGAVSLDFDNRGWAEDTEE
jgi:transcriptional regulator with XRE-family HTH domain